MTTTLVAPRTWRSVCAAPTTSVMSIQDMPAAARMHVEELLLLLPDAPVNPEALWDDAWFTRWRRDSTGTYQCRETFRATPDVTRSFADALAALAAEYGFSASVEAAG
ncbi:MULTISPECIES: hypothetical protein [unclassified Corynebacterium]|uniref:hypothetical protein n=1 Tax=unclassified Corynebacterium TaxID=2624378 RepID=UPI0008FB038E|nr:MULTISPECIES: hypothetical protein [unclassified Corynebacterium]MCQ4611812.1 hypothetical protein [Corynebacterium sp. CCUG 51687]OIR42893.1 hypothetical protein BJP06_07750 [Corynebacterium sp. NML120713]